VNEVADRHADPSVSGGSVLSTLLESNNVPDSSISVIVRGEDKAKAFRELGVNVILFNSLDDIELLQRVAGEHDSMT
jgi:uncharacterized protein YbjT (DUF2867 family)